MPTPTPMSPQNLQQVEVTSRIIVGALTMSVFFFAAVAATLGKWNPVLQLMQMIGIAFAATSIIMAWIVPMIIVRQHRQSLPTPPNDSVTPESFGGIFQTSTIIGCAILEGAAFFNLICYLNEGHFVGLIIAFICMLGLASHVPLPGKVQQWAEDQYQAWKTRS